MQAQSQPHVRSDSTVVIGYCFGGATVLDLAASYPDPITDNVLGKLPLYIATSYPDPITDNVLDRLLPHVATSYSDPTTDNVYISCCHTLLPATLTQSPIMS